jgi:5-methyltetrahydrofolate--homocysteine methyltransferase
MLGVANFEEISKYLIEGNANQVKELTQKAVDEGTPAGDVLNKALIPGMDIVGQRFRANEFYVPEVLIAARAMHASMDVLKPLLAEGDVETAGKVLLGTVKGDLHDIGKNLVGMMLEGGGFEVIDIGTDVKPETFVEDIKKHKPDIVGLSALLTTTMVAMKDTINAISEAGVRDQVKVMVGGAPVTQRYSDEIGADGYAADASSAVDVARGFGA